MNEGTIQALVCDGDRQRLVVDEPSVATPPASGGRRRRLSICWLLFAALLVWGAWADIQIVRGGVPYSEQLDEITIAKTAGRIFVEGDPNPHFFRYPSLPIYLCTAAYAVGYLEARWLGEANTRSELWTSSSFRADQTLASSARLVFAALGLIALAAAGLLARTLSSSPHALYLAPLILFGSGLYQFQARRYLNVDIVGMAFCMLCLLHFVRCTSRGSLAGSTALAGLLIGLAAASKYTLLVVATPWLIAYVSDEPKFIARRVFVLLAVAATTFVCLVPYSVLDASAFLADLRSEALHYRTGHIGQADFTSAPGFAHLLQIVEDVAVDYGGVLAGFALIGVVSTLRNNWRQAVQLLSFPLLLASALAIHRTHFARNALAIHALVAVYAAIGILIAMRRAEQAAAAVSWLRDRNWACKVISCVVLVAAGSTFPWSRMPLTHRLTADSRIAATNWLLEHAPSGAHVFVPDVLEFDARPLLGHFEVHPLSLQELESRSSLPLRRGDYVLQPRVTNHPQRPWERRAEQLDRLFEGVKPIVAFGAMPIVLGVAFWHTQGWTALSVGVVP